MLKKVKKNAKHTKLRMESDRFAWKRWLWLRIQSKPNTFCYCCFRCDAKITLKNVLQGKPKKKNTDVAIKQFHGTTDFYIKREVLTLKLAQTHKNIVKFIGFEKKHLIMELCTESLDIRLLKNENGLPYDELMVFVADFFAGLKHLRKFYIIHRDLKPGNVLVSRVNTKDVYKISDFGAARILQNNATYTSTYGTAEYMHPNILAQFYEMDDTPPTKLFMCKHEIWPIAVTLFEAATGQLPFESKEGRSNMKLQYKMMMGKKHDHICAKETDSGDIEWFAHLPEECQLDKTVKIAIETLLTGMLKVSFSSIFLDELKKCFFTTQFLYFYVFFFKFSNEMSFDELFVETDQFLKANKLKQQKVRKIRKVIKRHQRLNHRSVQ